jgi:translation initiation factor IF-2
MKGAAKWHKPSKSTTKSLSAHWPNSFLFQPSKLIAELFKNGVAATVNEKIDFDTAQIIVGELPDLEVELAKKEHQAAPARVKREASDQAETRPPVVAMMGHVDHGKTSLLDAIRGGDTAKGEAGGITQHLSAYQSNITAG